MKQVLQNLRDGQTLLQDVPAPTPRRDHLQIRTQLSLISAGTERMLVNFGKSSLIKKAMQQPDKVRLVLDKMKTDGIWSTWQTVQNKLDTPIPLGYCNVGVIEDTGGSSHFSVGDRVISNGKHAELVVVPKNLCVKIPDSVTNETASFTVIGAIALQGVRLLEPTLGETFVVMGLGLIGLMAVQILKANGCRVIGLDFDANRCQMAEQYGAETLTLTAEYSPEKAILALTQGLGVDGVLIAASTASQHPIRHAAHMCRKRGRIILVGVVGLNISRADFYEKELTFKVSCSYGPGRYDIDYEEKGFDYPLAYVRWTENRNFQTVLQLMAEHKINVDALISQQYDLDQAEEAYAQLSHGGHLGILLQYPRWSSADILLNTVSVIPASKQPLNSAQPLNSTQPLTLGFIGAGNYAASVLVPYFAASSAKLLSIAALNGVSSAHLANKFGFLHAVSQNQIILSDPNISAVVIATRHDTHASLVKQALLAGKHVFVEKPLAICESELADLEKTFLALQPRPQLMVGFNRRFSPHITKIKELLSPLNGVCSITMTINAGEVEPSHWTQDPAVGGGRVLGEVCHFVDLCRFLVGYPIVQVKATCMDSTCKDSVAVILKFSNGALATINYFCNGNKSLEKERLEVFAAGGILQMHNFKKTVGLRWPGFKKLSHFKQDKGQKACVQAFVNHVSSPQTSELIPAQELFEVMRVCFEIDRQRLENVAHV